MKKYILPILVICFLGSCDQSNEEQTPEPKSTSRDIVIETIDGCEYVLFYGNNKGGIVHHANCHNPAHKPPLQVELGYNSYNNNGRWWDTVMTDKLNDKINRLIKSKSKIPTITPQILLEDTAAIMGDFKIYEVEL